MNVKPLPARPNLEFYRKQSRHLLKSLKVGEAAAVQRLRDHHPHAARFLAPGTSAAAIKLADAQCVIAREHGFESWPVFSKNIGRLSRGNLVAAAQRGEVDAARDLLRADPSLIHSKDDEGHGLLYIAAMHGFNARQEGHRAFVDFLIEQGAEVDLHAAAFLARPDRAREILRGNPKAVNQPAAPYHSTPLHVAAERGDLNTVKALVEHGADLNARDKFGRTPLAVAAHAGPWKPAPATGVIDYLLEQGAKYDLFSAASLGSLDLLERVAAGGRTALDDRDAGGCTALWHAARNNRMEVVQWLVEHGATVNTPNADGQTPLSTAVLHLLSQQTDPALIRYLIEKGATPNACAAAALGDVVRLRRLLRERPESANEPLSGFSPAYYALHIWKPECLRELVRAGASLTGLEADLRNICGPRDPALLAELLGQPTGAAITVLKSTGSPEGWTPLHLAVMQGDLATARALLEGGAEAESPDARGRTPFFWAIIKRHFPTAELLLKHGAKINATWKGFSLLHHEAKDGKSATVEFLLQHGADPNIRDHRIQPGSTPLHGAARQDRLKAAKLLIEHGADVNARTEQGQTPLDAAHTSKRKKLVALLIAHGAQTGT